MKSFAIDVGWFKKRDASTDFEEKLRTMRAFEELRLREGTLLVDAEGRIPREYSIHLHAGSLGRMVLTYAMKNGMQETRSGSPSAACTSCLDAVQFDPADRPYIAVAQAAAGAFVAHEEKHLQATLVTGVGTSCRVPILDSEGFFAEMNV